MKAGIASDLHCHAWTMFSRTNADGVNSRLRYTLNELSRAANTVLAAGGDCLVISGDIFHTRGVLDPEVLNPTRATIREILESGVSIYAIPGNHDLKSKDTDELSSAIQNLTQETIEGATFRIFNRVGAIRHGPFTFGFVPWRWTTEALLEDLVELFKRPDASKMDVFIHAGIDGVLSGMPAHGLTDAQLAAFGFRHVFAGHYHNHHDFKNGVISVGASTHQTWGDVGTRAGFLLLDADGTVTFNDTKAPKFIDLTGKDELEMELECQGNFVRFRGPAMTQDQIKDLREQFYAWGALGVSIEVPKAVVTARTTAPAKGLTLEQSVEKFIAESDPHPTLTADQITKRALETLAASRIVYEEA